MSYDSKKEQFNVMIMCLSTCLSPVLSLALVNFDNLVRKIACIATLCMLMVGILVFNVFVTHMCSQDFWMNLYAWFCR